jgi:SAM-dependent methyltransferase
MGNKHLRKIDHITCAVRPDTIRQWAWFYIDILGGSLTLRCDDTNPSGDSSMMVWTIDFAEFGVALIAGVDRTEKSHVTAFVDKHGDHSFQHVALEVADLDDFCSLLAERHVNLLGDTLARKDVSGRYVRQVFGSPFHDEENSALVGFYEFVERPRDDEVEAGPSAPPPDISFSERAGELLYQQAQSEMLEDRRARMTNFSLMPANWVVPEPVPDKSSRSAVEIVARRGRREGDSEIIGEVHRWESYRSANSRFPKARAAEFSQMCRLANVRPGETIAEVGTGNGELTRRLASAVGPQGLVYTYDLARDNLVNVMLSNDVGLPIVPVPLPLAERNARFANGRQVDCVATLATFHHLDDRSLAAGTAGRAAAVAEFWRLLKPGGRLVIGDVGAGTAPQRYFDAIDDPRYCHPKGHPHDFLSGSELRDLVAAAGFTEIRFEVVPVPWVFASKAEAVEFLQAMHNARCSVDELATLAEQHLRFEEYVDGVRVDWELLFLVGRKI